jgi:hypothetical protein
MIMSSFLLNCAPYAPTQPKYHSPTELNYGRHHVQQEQQQQQQQHHQLRSQPPHRQYPTSVAASYYGDHAATGVEGDFYSANPHLGFPFLSSASPQATPPFSHERFLAPDARQQQHQQQVPPALSHHHQQPPHHHQQQQYYGRAAAHSRLSTDIYAQTAPSATAHFYQLPYDMIEKKDAATMPSSRSVSSTAGKPDNIIPRCSIGHTDAGQVFALVNDFASTSPRTSPTTQTASSQASDTLMTSHTATDLQPSEQKKKQQVIYPWMKKVHSCK